MDPETPLSPEDWPEYVPPPPLEPIWFEAAVIVTTWRFETEGHVWFVQAQDADEATARAIFDDYTAGAFPLATSAAYTPTNLELQADWTAGGFTVIARA